MNRISRLREFHSGGGVAVDERVARSGREDSGAVRAFQEDAGVRTLVGREFTSCDGRRPIDRRRARGCFRRTHRTDHKE
jgi:hypothetical protein